MDMVISHGGGELEIIGQAANEAAAAAAFADYMIRKSPNTLRTQAAALDTFGAYLADVGMPARGQLQTNPEAWRGVTWGMVAGFVRWQLAHGYAVATVNGRLSAVKTYAALASKAGVIAAGELHLIRAVSGYGRKDGRQLDKRRRVTRRGHKKPVNTAVSLAQARALKTHHDTATASGRRDAAIMALLLDHGLRVGELVALNAGAFDMAAGTMTFYREKVGATQTHRLTAAAAAAVAALLPDLGAGGAPLIQRVTKHGTLTGRRMTARGVRHVVGRLGEAVGVVGLSPHDCRHFWATDAARNETDTFRLQEAGGWASLAMPRRYVEAAAVANEGVRLSE